jgi:hypothetical protein
MSETNPNAGFIAHWKRVGPILERIRRDELRRFDWDKDWELVDSLMDSMPGRPQEPSKTSGLVELQRLMRKAFG